MSKLQKAIARMQRPDAPRGMGFGRQDRQAHRAMLLGVVVADGPAVKAALEAGADVVLLRTSASAAGAALNGGDTKAVVGVWLDSLDDAGAESLVNAGADFVVSPLASTAATAMDPDRMGQVLMPPADVTDTTLRALAPLGLDGLLVNHDGGSMSLAGQLELVRLASFAATPLIVTVAPSATAAELRVLRDSGGAVVVLPQGATPEQLTALGKLLEGIPPRKSRRDVGAEIALVPSMTAHANHEEEDEPDEVE